MNCSVDSIKPAPFTPAIVKLHSYFLTSFGAERVMLIAMSPGLAFSAVRKSIEWGEPFGVMPIKDSRTISSLVTSPFFRKRKITGFCRSGVMIVGLEKRCIFKGQGIVRVGVVSILFQANL